MSSAGAPAVPSNAHRHATSLATATAPWAVQALVDHAEHHPMHLRGRDDGEGVVSERQWRCSENTPRRGARLRQDRLQPRWMKSGLISVVMAVMLLLLPGVIGTPDLGCELSQATNGVNAPNTISINATSQTDCQVRLPIEPSPPLGPPLITLLLCRSHPVSTKWDPVRLNRMHDY